MGPGYFPTVLGALLAGIGLLVLLKSLTSATGGGQRRERAPPGCCCGCCLRWRRSLYCSIRSDLVLTTVIVVMLAAWAGHEFRLGEALLNAAVLALLSYLLFVWGLNQPMPVWPRFLAA